MPLPYSGENSATSLHLHSLLNQNIPLHCYNYMICIQKWIYPSNFSVFCQCNRDKKEIFLQVSPMRWRKEGVVFQLWLPMSPNINQMLIFHPTSNGKGRALKNLANLRTTKFIAAFRFLLPTLFHLPRNHKSKEKCLIIIWSINFPYCMHFSIFLYLIYYPLRSQHNFMIDIFW